MRPIISSRASLASLASLAALACFGPALPAVAEALPADQLGTVYGTYSARSSVVIELSRDGRQVKHAVHAWLATCSDGTPFRWHEDYAAIPISALGSFRSSFDSGQSPDGRVTYSIAGKVNKSRTKITGTVRGSVILRDEVAQTTMTCETGSLSFVARD